MWTVVVVVVVVDSIHYKFSWFTHTVWWFRRRRPPPPFHTPSLSSSPQRTSEEEEDLVPGRSHPRWSGYPTQNKGKFLFESLCFFVFPFFSLELCQFCMEFIGVLGRIWGNWFTPLALSLLNLCFRILVCWEDFRQDWRKGKWSMAASQMTKYF